MAIKHAVSFLGRQFLGFFSGLRQEFLPLKDRDSDKVAVAFSRACEGLIDEEEHEEVNDFIGHGEPAIAFEGLMISLMRADVLPEDFDLSIWRRIATEFNTVELATLDEHIWPKFEAWAGDKSA